MKKILTIAGSDSSGGAGIQADIKTITVHRMYAESVITSVTAQNTSGVYGIFDITADFVSKQLDAVFDDIFPDAIKIGMVSNSELIKVIADKIKKYNAKNIVIDPVMISTSGCRLISSDAENTLFKELLPIGTVITPNIPEAEALSSIKILNKNDMIKSAEKISKKLNTAVLIKGGHMVDNATDILYDKGSFKTFTSKRINNPNTHGTGCTLSSAIACGLADGKTLADSVYSAKEYLNGVLSAMLNLGKGKGPLNHMYNI